MFFESYLAFLKYRKHYFQISLLELDEFDHLTLKSGRTFFLEPRVPCGWGKFIWSSSILPSKTLVL